MVAKKVRDIKRGEFFTKKPVEYPNESQVFIKGDYVRTNRKYSCVKFSDVNSECFLKADTTVYVDFIF